jgi:hypothetical protein
MSVDDHMPEVTLAKQQRLLLAKQCTRAAFVGYCPHCC